MWKNISEKTLNIVNFLHVLLLILIISLSVCDLWLLLSIFRYFCSRYKIKALVTLSNLSSTTGHDTIPCRGLIFLTARNSSIFYFFHFNRIPPNFQKTRCEKNCNSTFPDIVYPREELGFCVWNLKITSMATELKAWEASLGFSSRGMSITIRDFWAHIRAHLPLSFSLRSCDFFLLLVSGLRLTFLLFSMFKSSWNISFTFSFVLADVSMKPQPHFFAHCWPCSFVTCRSPSGSSHLFPTSMSGAASRSLPFTSLMTSNIEASSASDWDDVTE